MGAEMCIRDSGCPPSITRFSHANGLWCICSGNMACPYSPVGKIIDNRILFSLAKRMAAFSITVLVAEVNFLDLHCSSSSDQWSISFLTLTAGMGLVLDVDEQIIALRKPCL